MSQTPSTSLSTASLPRNGKAGHKGQQTRAAILELALRLAARQGLESLSLGVLAEQMGMSKSGVFAHFGSREELQVEVVKEYHRRFEREVFWPALAEPRGLPRLCAMFERWLQRIVANVDCGCLYISGAVEFDGRTGTVKDVLMGAIKAWQGALARAVEQAVQEQHLHPHTPIEQLVFELHGLILALHFEVQFLRQPLGLERARSGLAGVLQRHQP